MGDLEGIRVGDLEGIRDGNLVGSREGTSDSDGSRLGLREGEIL